MLLEARVGMTECLQVNKSFSMKMPPPYLSVNFCVQELSFPGSGT
jgi:hypothetical protein